MPLLVFSKGFFRRTVHSNSVPQCLGNQTCRITPSNRNMCKSCRFKKCLEVGMSQKREFLLVLDSVAMTDRSPAIQFARVCVCLLCRSMTH